MFVVEKCYTTELWSNHNVQEGSDKFDKTFHCIWEHDASGIGHTNYMNVVQEAYILNYNPKKPILFT